MRTNITCILAATILFLGCNETKSKLGYETEYEKEVYINVGDIKSTRLISK